LAISTLAGTAFAGSSGDVTPPEVGKPNPGFTYNVAVAQTKKPLSVYYMFDVTDQSPLAETTLQQKVGSNAYADVALPSSTATQVTLNVKPSNTTVRTLRASAEDQWGNASAFTVGDPFKVRVLQDGAASFTKTGTWTPASNTSSYYGGTVRYATAAGASQTYQGNFSDARLVFTKGPNMGKVKVYFDGSLEETIDLYSSSPQYRKVLFTIGFSYSVDHEIKIVATGTKNTHSTGKRVEFDALLLMNP